MKKRVNRGGMSADLANSDKALQQLGSSMGSMDGPFAKEYKRFMSQQSWPKTPQGRTRPLNLNQTMYFVDPSQYRTLDLSTHRSKKRFSAYTPAQLKLLQNLFDTSSGILSPLHGERDAFQTAERRKGKSSKTFLKKYVKEFGGERAKRHVKDLSYEELDRERRRIARAVFPYLDRIGDGHGALHGLYVLENHNYTQAQKAATSRKRKQNQKMTMMVLGSSDSDSDDSADNRPLRPPRRAQTGTSLHKTSRTKGRPRPPIPAQRRAPPALPVQKPRPRVPVRPKPVRPEPKRPPTPPSPPRRQQRMPATLVPRPTDAPPIRPHRAATMIQQEPTPPPLPMLSTSATGRTDDAPIMIRPFRTRHSSAPVKLPSAFRPIRSPVRGARTPIFGRVRPRQEIADEDAAHAAAHRFARASPTVQQQRTNLSVETVYHGAERNTSYTHLIEGDLAPVGRVHLVKMGDAVGDQRENHIMSQMDADSNMGAQLLREQSKRGPFKRSSGRSRVMDRSAHVSYRRRLGAIEITITRGITDHELDTLISKMGAHRLSTHGAFLYILKGNSKKLVARLDKVNLETFRNKIRDCLDKYPRMGLLIQDTYEKGALHKGYSHGMEMKENMRQMKNLFATN
jgi:hypothetical protein